MLSWGGWNVAVVNEGAGKGYCCVTGFHFCNHLNHQKKTEEGSHEPNLGRKGQK